MKKLTNYLFLMFFCFYEVFVFPNITLAPNSKISIKSSSDNKDFISPHRVGDEVFISVIASAIKEHGEMQHEVLAKEIGSSLQIVQGFRKKYDAEIVNRIGKDDYLLSLKKSKLVTPKKIGEIEFARLIAAYIKKHGEASNKKVAETIGSMKDTVRIFRVNKKDLIYDELGGFKKYLAILKRNEQISVEKVGVDIFQDLVVKFIKKNGEASHSDIAVAIGATMSNVQRFRLKYNDQIIKQIGFKKYVAVLKKYNQLSSIHIGAEKFAEVLAEIIKDHGEFSNSQLAEKSGSSQDIIQAFRAGSNDLIITALGGQKAYKAILKTRKQVNAQRIGKEIFLNEIVQIVNSNNGLFPKASIIAEKIGASLDVVHNFIKDNKKDIESKIDKKKARKKLADSNSISAETIGYAKFLNLIADNVKKNGYKIIDLKDLADQINSTKRIVFTFIRDHKQAIIDYVGRKEYYAAVAARNETSTYTIGEEEFMDLIIDYFLKYPGPFPAGKDIAASIGSTVTIVNRFIRNNREELLLKATKRTKTADKYLHVLWQRDKTLAVKTFLQRHMKVRFDKIIYPPMIKLEDFFKSNYSTIKPYYEEVIESLTKDSKNNLNVNELLNTDQEIAAAVGRSLDELYEYFEYVTKPGRGFEGDLWSYLSLNRSQDETDGLISFILHYDRNDFFRYINWRADRLERTMRAIERVAYSKYNDAFQLPDNKQISESLGIKIIDIEQYMFDKNYIEDHIHHVWSALKKEKNRFSKWLSWYFDPMKVTADYLVAQKIFLFDDDMIEKISKNFNCDYSDVEELMEAQKHNGVFYKYGVIDYIFNTIRQKQEENNDKRKITISDVGEFVFVRGMVNASIDYFQKKGKLPKAQFISTKTGLSKNEVDLYLDIMYEELVEVSDDQGVVDAAMWRIDQDEALTQYCVSYLKTYGKMPSRQEAGKHFGVRTSIINFSLIKTDGHNQKGYAMVELLSVITLSSFIFMVTSLFNFELLELTQMLWNSISGLKNYFIELCFAVGVFGGIGKFFWSKNVNVGSDNGLGYRNINKIELMLVEKVIKKNSNLSLREIKELKESGVFKILLNLLTRKDSVSSSKILKIIINLTQKSKLEAKYFKNIISTLLSKEYMDVFGSKIEKSLNIKNVLLLVNSLTLNNDDNFIPVRSFRAHLGQVLLKNKVNIAA